ncbi:MAG: LacI family DNA-binding transcriptional regulator [Clostridia bacterium]|nr:LacI family DNA-binding transcriptional regulator [Clostridia bacterium]
MNQKKIAQLAHVSPSTVSKALRGSRDVSPEISEQIRQIALDIGYIKEKSERKLSNLRDKKPLIAIFCPEIISTYYSRITSMLQEEINTLGGESFVCAFHFSHEKFDEMIDSLVVRSGCDGIISLSSYRGAEATQLPLVYVGSYEKFNQRDCIFCDLDHVMEIAIHHLTEQGCRKIGYMGERLTSSKQKAFVSKMQEKKLVFEKELLFVSEKRFEHAGFDCAEKLLACTERPDAIIAAYDEIALGAMHLLSECGIRIPQEIAFLGINNISFSSYCGIGLSSIEIFSERECKEAIQKLFQNIFEGTTTPQCLWFEPTLIVRESTKRIE